MRTCSRCKNRVPNDDQCATCLNEFNHRRDATTMTTEERLTEFDSWFRTRLPEISNSRVAQRVAELVGHSVHPMDIATSRGRDFLRRQIVRS